MWGDYREGKKERPVETSRSSRSAYGQYGRLQSPSQPVLLQLQA
jgi:hypothetical protein